MSISQDRLEEILRHARQKHGAGQDALIPTLAEINEALGSIPAEALEELARAGRHAAETAPLSASQINGVATFYSMFSTETLGRHVVRFCESAPCHVVGGRQVLEALQKNLRLNPGQTSADGQWSLLSVSCLGLCSVGPVFLVDEDVYGNVTPENVPEILAKYREEQP
ncbi:MAG: NADH-quinone oxidoreductase subunit NuoE [Anaerolineales bacterium]